MNIRSYIEEHDINFEEFTEWAFGNNFDNSYIDEIPSLWTAMHPEVPIMGADSIPASLDKMINLYKTEST